MDWAQRMRGMVWLKRLAWFVGLWLAGVAVTGAVAMAIRSVLR
jgi:hypothetical protein